MTAPAPSVRVRHSMFEGLYDRVLKPQGEFRARLTAAGYDAALPQVEYPVKVWMDCLDVSVAHLYAAERPERAVWLLGRRFIEGYLETIIGKVISAGMPFLSAESFLKKVPRFVSSGIDVTTTLEWKGPHHARLTFAGARWYSGPLMAGVMEVSLERVGVKGAAFTANRAGEELAWVEVTWP